MAESQNGYDLVVIGAGPGGYVAAIRAAQLGMKVACIDKESRFGGTCLRVGCIPSKALLDASEKFEHARHSYASLGIECDKVSLNLPAMMARKQKVVEQLTTGVSGLLKKNKIDKIVGRAAFKSPTAISVTDEDGKATVIEAKNYLIATGSVPVDLPFLRQDGKRIISSDQAIALEKVPEKLVVIGAGVIGVELGSVWSRLGSKVTILEMAPNILPGGDEEMSRQMEKILRKQGLEFYTGAKVTGVKEEAGNLSVTFEWESKAKEQPADIVLVAVGRKPYTDGLGLEAAGVKLDDRKRIAVDDHYRTSAPNIYAIGDVIPGAMLAHKAEDEAVAFAELLAGKAGHVDYGIIPGVVYTNPELASVGKSEEQLKAASVEYTVGKFSFRANGRALAMNEIDGMVKVLADKKTDRLLGVHILGPQASSMISEAAAIMSFGGSAEDMARICHAHPTLPEALMEAARAAGGWCTQS